MKIEHHILGRPNYIFVGTYRHLRQIVLYGVNGVDNKNALISSNFSGRWNIKYKNQ